jgi:hypothetical protein
MTLFTDTAPNTRYTGGFLSTPANRPSASAQKKPCFNFQIAQVDMPTDIAIEIDPLLKLIQGLGHLWHHLKIVQTLLLTRLFFIIWDSRHIG